MRVMEPMLLVMVTSVARARSALDTPSRFSDVSMLPKLARETPRENTEGYIVEQRPPLETHSTATTTAAT